MTEQNFDVDRALDAELEHNVFTERRRKLAEIREQGVAYPNDFNLNFQPFITLATSDGQSAA